MKLCRPNDTPWTNRESATLSGEHVDLASTMPAKVTELWAHFNALDETYHPPVVPPPTRKPEFCAAALRHGGWTAPFLDEP
eukprot:SAG22_NODE_639_length_8255_cov_13.659882_7_plen_81_part_00